MTIEYLDRLQPRIPDVQQKILDVREIPEIRVNGRYPTISAGSSWRPRRRSLSSRGGWPILILILIALAVGAVGSHLTQPRTATPHAEIINPTPTADPGTSATDAGSATQAPTAAPHTPLKCTTQPAAENSAENTLPDMVGQNAQAASEQLNQLGLLNVQLTSANPNYAMVLVAANWTVVSTNPAPCTVITPHVHVVLHVTKPGRGLGSLFEFPWSH
jgi:hypothetical protein